MSDFYTSFMYVIVRALNFETGVLIIICVGITAVGFETGIKFDTIQLHNRNVLA
jgi:hypothetical protein